VGECYRGGDKIEKKKGGDTERPENGAEMMICGSHQCACVTGMALQGSMKSFLIVRSGNRSSQLLAMTDLFTFQRLDPTQKKMIRGSRDINIS